jgi:hypothetical protein
VGLMLLVARVDFSWTSGFDRVGDMSLGFEVASFVLLELFGG